MKQLDRFFFNIFVAMGIVTTAAFTMWWFLDDHLPQNFDGATPILDIFLFVLLTYVVFHDIIKQVLFWIVASHIKPQQTPKPRPGLKVAFITTFVPGSESHDLLHKILPAMVAASYKHDTWLLDEGNDKECQEICKKYGVNYFTRFDKEHYNQPEGKFASKTKGGNHNAWYDAEGYKYDIVAQIDTDFVPKRNFLTRTLGYFNDPDVAFVGTPQIYGNTDSFIARGAAQQTYNFYGPILRGLANIDMTFMIGANHLVCVSALKDIDYYNAHLTEDLITGMELHARKWKSKYVHEALAIGEGPSTWTSYFNQQMRWAFGCMDILFHHTGRLVKQMRSRHRIIYLLMQQHYFTGLAMAIGILLITLYALFGISPVNIDLVQLLQIYIPLLIWHSIINFWMQKYFVNPKEESGLLIAGRVVSIAVWPIYFLAFIGVLRRKRLVFKVTPKGNGHKLTDPMGVFLPQLFIVILMGFNLVMAGLNNNTGIVMIFWMVITGGAFAGIVLSLFMPKFLYLVKSLAISLYIKLREIVGLRPLELGSKNV